MQQTVQQHQRVLLDKVCLGIVSYLESLEDCHEISFQCNKECSNSDFSVWEKKNVPFKLPNDLKKFYSSIFNGFSLNWTIEVNDQVIPVGEIRFNAVDEIKPVTVEYFCVQQVVPPEVTPPTMGNCTMFSLDQNCSLGHIVLLYRNRSSDGGNLNENGMEDSPEIWLLTNSCQLIYIAQSFIQYFRLMVTHLGIFHWQLAFSDEGVSELTENYMHLFCKERLVVDKHYRLQA